jgi:hypothetical protein
MQQNAAVPRTRALIAVVAASLLAWPATALANPTISISSSVRSGKTTKPPVTVRHVLTLTAGAVPEQVSVDVDPAVKLVVAGATVQPPTAATGPSTATCPGRWSAMHDAYRFADPPDDQGATFTIAAGQTATVTADVTVLRAPYNEETLDATWGLELAEGPPLSVFSQGPTYEGPLAVELDFRVIRAADGSYVVAGTADPDVEKGRVELWGYPPGRTRAQRLARVPVSSGEWSFNDWRPARRGAWELYARYSGGGRDYANSASLCGTPFRVLTAGPRTR